MKIDHNDAVGRFAGLRHGMQLDAAGSFAIQFGGLCQKNRLY